MLLIYATAAITQLHPDVKASELYYGGIAVIVPRADRPELVAKLSAEGLKQQQIADTLGVDQGTVSRDIMQTHNTEQPATRTDSLGRERPTTYQRSEPPAEPRAPHPTDGREVGSQLAVFERIAAQLDGIRYGSPHFVQRASGSSSGGQS